MTTLPTVIELETTLWLEWYSNDDGYWDSNAAEYRRIANDSHYNEVDNATDR